MDCLVFFKFLAKPSLPPGVLPMNTLYGMQQGLIHAYVSSNTFSLLSHSFCMVDQCQLTCVVFFIPLAALAIWIWRSSKTTNGNNIIIFSTMQFRTQKGFDTLKKNNNHLPIVTQIGFWETRSTLCYALISSLLMCVLRDCKLVSTTDILSFCIFLSVSILWYPSIPSCW